MWRLEGAGHDAKSMWRLEGAGHDAKSMWRLEVGSKSRGAGGGGGRRVKVDESRRPGCVEKVAAGSHLPCRDLLSNAIGEVEYDWPIVHGSAVHRDSRAEGEDESDDGGLVPALLAACDRRGQSDRRRRRAERDDSSG
jgi:hypothetical protein